MTNEVAGGLQLTAEAIKALKPGEPFTLYIREPMWPVFCLLGVLLVFIALLVLLVRGFVWWRRRKRLDVAAAAHGRFCGWLANRMGLLGFFITGFLSGYGVLTSLHLYANAAPSKAHEVMFLFSLYHALLTLGAGFAVFLAGWLQAFVFELLWRRWELRQAAAKLQP